MNNVIPFEGGLLRQLEDKHIDQLIPLCDDELIRRYYFGEEESISNYWSKVFANQRYYSAFLNIFPLYHIFGIFSDDFLKGVIHFHTSNYAKDFSYCEYSLGFLVGEKYRNQHLGLTATSAALKYMANKFEFSLFTAEVLYSNIPSKKLLANLGFKEKKTYLPSPIKEFQKTVRK